MNRPIVAVPLSNLAKTPKLSQSNQFDDCLSLFTGACRWTGQLRLRLCQKLSQSNQFDDCLCFFTGACTPSLYSNKVQISVNKWFRYLEARYWVPTSKFPYINVWLWYQLYAFGCYRIMIRIQLTENYKFGPIKIKDQLGLPITEASNKFTI